MVNEQNFAVKYGCRTVRSGEVNICRWSVAIRLNSDSFIDIASEGWKLKKYGHG